jgi:hypothetical protein
MTGDFNHDGLTEVYLFTEANDSLFLYGFDNINDDTFFLERQFVMCGNQEHLNPEWDIRFRKGKMIDYNNDGREDIHFGIVSGNSQEPRAIFIFSIEKKRILQRSDYFGAHFGALNFGDIDSDGELDIIVGGQAN